ncbi:hypothetical protein CDEST_13970 [Colletotrichum destructivum]|uniref:Uncharacterized protein n=1 Tax=Colletotrichum destructivum TaxID=34406 RepID=A0AAX4J0T6_9PEZI|nr:hypothetical protein CDEST_13970 [Colletotrichum destructivum]
MPSLLTGPPNQDKTWLMRLDKGKGKHGQVCVCVCVCPAPLVEEYEMRVQKGPFRGLRFTASRFRRVILGLQITSHLFLLFIFHLPGYCRRCRTLRAPHRGGEKGERRVVERKGKKKNPRRKKSIANTMEYPDSLAALTCPTVCRSPAGERASQPG